MPLYPFLSVNKYIIYFCSLLCTYVGGCWMRWVYIMKIMKLSFLLHPFLLLLSSSILTTTTKKDPFFINTKTLLFCSIFLLLLFAVVHFFFCWYLILYETQSFSLTHSWTSSSSMCYSSCHSILSSEPYHQKDVEMVLFKYHHKHFTHQMP